MILGGGYNTLCFTSMLICTFINCRFFSVKKLLLWLSVDNIKTNVLSACAPLQCRFPSKANPDSAFWPFCRIKLPFNALGSHAHLGCDNDYEALKTTIAGFHKGWMILHNVFFVFVFFMPADRHLVWSVVTDKVSYKCT